MKYSEIQSSIESLLFVYSDPLDEKEIAAALDAREDEVARELKSLMIHYEESGSGIRLIKLNGKYQLVSNPMNAGCIRKLFMPSRRKSLTQAALETLAIIAYKQPVTKIEIEDIRGVKCDKPLKTLAEYSLIEEAGRLKKIGNPIQYRTTEEFLRVFGLESLKELPQLDSFKEQSD
ncbi:MAG: SMC-Scp complex subunit ScpB [Peptoclostridium sp.]|uniref:SMC-Scp complex subunit ScpB n=1 Tax=Peptoclostridium sp. TaxID=1904860 RepID=UPI00139E9943|nr:SMC-Scp complex subunit ScpB [Peptoclostridium sp.]MZQ75608.1 SMC-Scp complex subunit ScpB [Peptoclostridium sp.]